MSETTANSQGNATATSTALAKPASVPTYQMGLFETDKFVTTPKVARAFGIKPVVDKTGATIGFANTHLKRKEIAEAHAGDLKGQARKDKVDKVIRESEIELAAKITAYLVINKGKIGAKSLRVRRDDEGIEHMGVQFRQIPDNAKADLERLMDAYGAKSAEELVTILTKGKGTVVEAEVIKTATSGAQK